MRDVKARAERVIEHDEVVMPNRVVLDGFGLEDRLRLEVLRNARNSTKDGRVQ